MTNIKIGRFTLNQAARTLHYEGKAVRLTSQRVNLLALIMSGEGNLVKNEEIDTKIFDAKRFNDPRTSIRRAQISHVRNEASHAFKINFFKHLVTVRGKGYRFIDPEDPK